MTRRQNGPVKLRLAAVQSFTASDRMNQMLIEHLDPAAWKASLPGEPKRKVRTIVAIFTHLHNVRCKWVRLTAPHLPLPQQLKRGHCTPDQARAGLAESAARCGEMLAYALDGDDEVRLFHRDGWARPWAPGLEMLCYMLSHEAHHRGQVCLLAHQLGFPIAPEISDGIWNWEKLWKDSGATLGSF